MRITYLFVYCLGLCFLNSCVSYESLLNYDQAPVSPIPTQPINNYRPIIIQANDILNINVSSNNQQAAIPFQINTSGTGANTNTPQGLLMNGYLVNTEGSINFPTIGRVQLGGLSIQQAQDTLLSKLLPYFNEAPIVNIRLLNFNISVNGEVRSPGTFNVVNERITVLEALTLAGDFTPYSRRDSVMIIRETQNERSFGYVDFNSPTIFESPYFYLRQNDVVYIRPLKRKIATVQDPVTRVLAWVSAVTGITAIVLTLSRR
jgi:polysaccharide export outer membrane protein